MSMNPLFLSGFGIRISRAQGELYVTDERADRAYRFKPRRCPYTSISLDGHSGFVTFAALHWLSRNNVPLFIHGYDGSIISSILPPSTTWARLRRAQFKASENSKVRFRVARALVSAKISISVSLLEIFGQRSHIQREIALAKKEAKALGEARTLARLRSVEARVALRYWQGFAKSLPSGLGFETRSTKSRPNKASDPVNLALNYSYGFLESVIRAAVNVVGLEPSIGFLHEFSDSSTKQSLVYDIEELYRWLCDLTVMQAFQSGTLSPQSFSFAESDPRFDYRLCFSDEAKGRLRAALTTRFNTRVMYRGRRLTWDSIIKEKAAELGRYLIQQERRFAFGKSVSTQGSD
jgi:CRISPR-associated protein Cas1